MDKLIVIKILLIFSLNVFGQGRNPSELGIGFAAMDDPSNLTDESIKVYSNEMLTEEFEQTYDSRIIPFYNKPGYGILYFVCLELTPNYYKVLINDQDIGYIKNDSIYNFLTWEKVLSTASVARLDKSELIYENWRQGSKEVTNNCERDIRRTSWRVLAENIFLTRM